MFVYSYNITVILVIHLIYVCIKCFMVCLNEFIAFFLSIYCVLMYQLLRICTLGLVKFIFPQMYDLSPSLSLSLSLLRTRIYNRDVWELKCVKVSCGSIGGCQPPTPETVLLLIVISRQTAP